jgi:hypothetical protein
MEKLDNQLLSFVKRGFIAGDPSQQPAPGGDPAAMGGAPAPGGDPAAQGDPNAQPAPMPPSGMDPAMAGMMGGGMPAGGAAPSGSSTITIDEMIKLFKLFKGNEGGGAAAPAPQGDPRLDHIITLLHGARGGQ